MSNKMDFIKKVIDNISEEKKKDSGFLVSSSLKDDKDFVLKSMKANPEIASKVYDLMSDDLKNDDDVILAALEDAPTIEKKEEVVKTPTAEVQEEVKEEVKEDSPVFDAQMNNPFKSELPVENQNPTWPSANMEVGNTEVASAPMFFSQEEPKEEIETPVVEKENTILPSFNDLEGNNTFGSDFSFKNNLDMYNTQAEETDVNNDTMNNIPIMGETNNMVFNNMNEMYNNDQINSNQSIIR